MNGVALGIDWVNDSAEWVFQQVSHQDAADSTRGHRGADHGYRTGLEDRIK
jgi:hypothetical protein